MHPLLSMNVMLDFICMCFAELWETGSKWKIQHENIICLHWESNQQPFAFQTSAMDIDALYVMCVGFIKCQDSVRVFKTHPVNCQCGWVV